MPGDRSLTLNEPSIRDLVTLPEVAQLGIRSTTQMARGSVIETSLGPVVEIAISHAVLLDPSTAIEDMGDIQIIHVASSARGSRIVGSAATHLRDLGVEGMILSVGRGLVWTHENRTLITGYEFTVPGDSQSSRIALAWLKITGASPDSIDVALTGTLVIVQPNGYLKPQNVRLPRHVGMTWLGCVRRREDALSRCPADVSSYHRPSIDGIDGNTCFVGMTIR